MIYGDVCSGISAPTVAWTPLGWRCAFYSEVDKFPRAVLRHHYPDTPLRGDFTEIEDGDHEPIDLLVGGTPCQSFSVAGKRLGLDDPRGNLALEFLRLARRLRPRWLVWENVPGLLSSDEGRDFGAFLGLLGECGYGWAYRVLDAQHFGVPQRRRRVFVVGHLGDWRPAAAVLLEPESLRGDPPPRREAGQGVARPVASSPAGGSGYRNDVDTADNLIATTLRGRDGAKGVDSDCTDTLIAYGGNNTAGPIDTATAVNAHGEPHGRCDFESETFIALQCNGGDVGTDLPSLRAGHGCVQSGVPAIAFHARQDSGPVTHPLDRDGHSVAVAIQERAITENPDAGPDGVGVRSDDTAFTLEARTRPQAVAFAQKSRCEVRQVGGDGQTTGAVAADVGVQQQTYIAGPSMRVRRVTPREAERLQGFPDDYTLIPYRGRPAADGPRYRALGNSMAVPVVRWIGGRIQAFEDAVGGAP